MLDAVLGKVAALKRAAEPEQSGGISGCYDAVRIRNGVKLGFAAGQQGGIRKTKLPSAEYVTSYPPASVLYLKK